MVALAALLGACSQERIESRERLSFSSEPVGGGRLSVVGERPAAPAARRATIDPVARVPWGGGVLPLVSADGRRAAVEASGAAPHATRLGDPLPPGGLDVLIEVVSLDASSPGLPGARLTGPWMLGRASTPSGFLVERPHLDGRRDIALAGWDAGLEVLVQDAHCNAHATIAADGTLAWSRRHPESGHWRLVVRRGGREVELTADEGSDWLMPVLSGDGRGLFAIELRSGAASFAWLPFGADGLPSPGAAKDPGRLRSPASARANLAWAVRSLEPVSGTAASPPGSGRLLAWLPDAATMVLWQPGSMPERLAPGSLAGLEVDDANVIVTVASVLLRQALGAPAPHPVIADEPWVPRPIDGAPGEVTGMVARGNQVQFARLRLVPATDAR